MKTDFPRVLSLLRKEKGISQKEAANQLGVSPKECLVVGDRVSDLLCATNVGASAVLVLTGYGKKEKDEALRLYPTLSIIFHLHNPLSTYIKYNHLSTKRFHYKTLYHFHSY